MSNLWCLEKISILPLVISATGIVPQSLFKNLKILDLDNTLVSEIQKGILLLNFGFLCTKNAHKNPHKYVTFFQEICQIYSSSQQFMYFFVFYFDGTSLKGKSNKTTKCN
jgi:hypothetical protein